MHDAEGYVRQGTDITGDLVSAWLFDPDGTVLEGPNGPVSHLICGGVYDGSTGLLYKGGRYFDPSLGIWLALLPLAVLQAWPRRKKRKGGYPWVMLLCVGLLVTGILTACGEDEFPEETELEILCAEVDIPHTPQILPLPINFLLMYGSDVQTLNNVDVEIAQANAIFSQPLEASEPGKTADRIQIVRGQVKRAEETQTRQLLGGDLELHYPEDQDPLLRYNRAHNTSIDLTAYYVQSIDLYDDTGYYVKVGEFEPGVYRGASVIIGNNRSARTLAHEVAHVLGLDHLQREDEQMHGVAPADYDDNLMRSSEGTGGPRYTGGTLSVVQLERLAQGYYHSERLYPTPTPSW